MRQFSVLFRKEWTESIRDFKWIWLPIVFAILGVMEPLTLYYTPQLIEQFGGLPEGTVIEIPLPTAEQAIVSTAGQLNMFGILVVILAFMGTLAGERKSGTAAMVLVKPVSYSSFVVAKWVHGLLLVFVSFLLGIGLSWYYTYQLFGAVDVADFLSGMFTYALWLMFIFTMTLLFSSFSSKPGAAAFGTLSVTIVFSFLASLLPEKLKWSPFALSTFANEYWLGQSPENIIYLAIIVTVGMITAMVFGAIVIFKKRELA